MHASLIFLVLNFYFQNGLNRFCSSISFYFKSKIVEGSHEMQKILCLLTFSPNVHFRGCDFLFLVVLTNYTIKSIISVVVSIYKINVLMKYLFLLQTWTNCARARKTSDTRPIFRDAHYALEKRKNDQIYKFSVEQVKQVKVNSKYYHEYQPISIKF